MLPPPAALTAAAAPPAWRAVQMTGQRVAELSGELSFNTGDVMTVRELPGYLGWLEGCTQGGLTGRVPTSWTAPYSGAFARTRSVSLR